MKMSLFAAGALALAFNVSAPAAAQEAYKTGDRVECDPNLTGRYLPGTIEPYEKTDFQIPGKHRGWYWVRLDARPGKFSCQPKQMRRLTALALQPVDPNSRERTARPEAEGQAPRAGTNRYGTRDPQTCDDTSAPRSGVITAALARQYVICDREGVRRRAMHIVENVKVQVGGGRAYQPQSDLSYSDIDVNSPIYPLRGSLSAYQCVEVDANRAHSGFNLGRNCILFEERKATGSCYRTTFADWKCSMYGVSGMTRDDEHPNVAPPK